MPRGDPFELSLQLAILEAPPNILTLYALARGHPQVYYTAYVSERHSILLVHFLPILPLSSYCGKYLHPRKWQLSNEALFGPMITCGRRKLMRF